MTLQEQTKHTATYLKAEFFRLRSPLEARVCSSVAETKCQCHNSRKPRHPIHTRLRYISGYRDGTEIVKLHWHLMGGRAGLLTCVEMPPIGAGRECFPPVPTYCICKIKADTVSEAHRASRGLSLGLTPEKESNSPARILTCDSSPSIWPDTPPCPTKHEHTTASNRCSYRVILAGNSRACAVGTYLSDATFLDAFGGENSLADVR